jgi:hypothetical protein
MTPNANELGDRLAGVSGFDNNNMIVWIGATWPGSLKGLIDDQDRPAPAPTLFPPPTDGSPFISRVPYPMCQQSVTDENSPLHCGEANRVNAVRVFNAGAALPGSMRITIASSLPLYVLGSVDRETPGEPLQVLPSTFFGAGFEDDNYQLGNGPDVFFAADSVTLLSDDWDDRDRPWIDGTGSSSVLDGKKVKVKNASDDIPAYNASFLVGRTLAKATYKHPFGFERALRFLERYPTINRSPIVTGSILVGFRSVYAVAPVCYGNKNTDQRCAEDAPWRHFWSTDLATGGGQPPGMPAFSLRAQGETIPDSMRIDFGSLFPPFLFGF